MANGVDLNPQAEGGLPGLAADAGMMVGPPAPPDLEIAPAPTAEEVVRRSAYGDTGTANYDALRNAGRMAPGAPAAPLSTLAGAPPGGGSPLDTLGNVLLGVSGEGGREILAERQKAAATAATQRAAAEKAMRENLKEFHTDITESAFKMFPGRPDLAAEWLQRRGAERGIPVDPATVVTLQHQREAGLLPRGEYNKIVADPNTPTTVLMQFGTNIKAVNEAVQAEAATREAIEKATQAEATTRGLPEKQESERVKAALDIANKLRTAQQPPSPSDLKVLAAGGLEPVEVPIPGVPGGKMWSTQPIGTGKTPTGTTAAPATISAEKLSEQEAKAAAAKAKAREGAVTTMNTRTMKEKVPKVLNLLGEVRTHLAAAEPNVGPGASRLRKFLAGDVGASDPTFVKYSTAADLLATLLMQMHVGSRGSEGMMEHFKNLLATNKQSPENMRAALDVIEQYANSVKGTPEGKEVEAPPDAGAVPKTADDYTAGW